jgi:hypothetical protein
MAYGEERENAVNRWAHWRGYLRSRCGT